MPNSAQMSTTAVIATIMIAMYKNTLPRWRFTLTNASNKPCGSVISGGFG